MGDNDTRDAPSVEQIRNAVLDAYLDGDDLDTERLAADLAEARDARRPRVKPDLSQGRGLPKGHGRTPAERFADWWRAGGY